ncbi:MAG: hypothetical protein JW740_02285 [Candidatus Zambryskibacteria bacterium]|nr:hypothetical protein [Candidatus Zambryskibacteria bacterium]
MRIKIFVFVATLFCIPLVLSSGCGGAEKQLEKQLIAANEKISELEQELQFNESKLAFLETEISRFEGKIEKETQAEKLALNIVRKGEGIESVFIRQIVSDPKYFGLEKFADNKSELKKKAGNVAHQFAIKLGFYDFRYDGELRVSEPDKMGVNLRIDNQGNILCDVFIKDNSFPDNPNYTLSSSSAPIFLAQENSEGRFFSPLEGFYFQPPIFAGVSQI